MFSHLVPFRRIDPRERRGFFLGSGSGDGGGSAAFLRFSITACALVTVATVSSNSSKSMLHFGQTFSDLPITASHESQVLVSVLGSGIQLLLSSVHHCIPPSHAPHSKKQRSPSR